jgi:citrate lyase synthetase
MANIGLVPMAAKPYHAGHDGLVRIAAQENDEVLLFVSLSDRDEVSGEAMGQIWKTMIEPTLPTNVKVAYGGSPVGNVYKVLGDADKEQSEDVFSVYSDPTDIQENYKTLDKYAGNLMAKGQVKLRPVERTSTVDVSGTKMRQLLAQGDKKAFISMLPKGIDGGKVWDLLTTMKPQPKKKAAGSAKKPAATKPGPAPKKTRAEGLLRRYVRLLLGM